MIGLCSGGFTWHRDHDDFRLTVFRLVEKEDEIVHEKVGEILAGSSFNIEEGGVRVTIENPCPHAWGPRKEAAFSDATVRRCTYCGERQYD